MVSDWGYQDIHSIFKSLLREKYRKLKPERFFLIQEGLTDTWFSLDCGVM